MSRRVVVSGLGIISSLGTNYSNVTERLKLGQSGIKKVDKWVELGLTSTVAGLIENIDNKKTESGISKKELAYMPEAALYCALAAKDAVKDSGLTDTDLANPRGACLVGSGVSGLLAIYEGARKTYSNKSNRMSPYTVLHAMSSSCSASVANILSMRGRSYSISSACATSMHNIGHGYELIRDNVIDMAVAGGGEEVNELIAAAFCAMRLAMSTHYNDRPQSASRPYDAARDGFVISGGAGILILEDFESAKKRGAKIYAEILGYSANSDANDIVLPEPEGRQAANCIRRAIEIAGVREAEIDYINTHGTSTVEGDIAEVKALKSVFTDRIPPFSSTKSMSGHAIGASGVNELIYCISMLENQFIAPSINIDNVDPAFEELPIVAKTQDVPLRTIIKNSFGFGGTNAVIVLGKH